MLNLNQLFHVLIGMKSAVVAIVILKGVEEGKTPGELACLALDMSIIHLLMIYLQIERVLPELYIIKCS